MMQDRLKIRVWDKRKNNYIEDFVFNFINKYPYITVEYFDNEYAYTHSRKLRSYWQYSQKQRFIGEQR